MATRGLKLYERVGIDGNRLNTSKKLEVRSHALRGRTLPKQGNGGCDRWNANHRDHGLNRVSQLGNAYAICSARSEAVDTNLVMEIAFLAPNVCGGMTSWQTAENHCASGGTSTRRWNSGTLSRRRALGSAVMALDSPARMAFTGWLLTPGPPASSIPRCRARFRTRFAAPGRSRGS